MEYKIVTLQENPDLVREIGRLHAIGWPTFMRKDPVADQYWDALLKEYPGLQFFLLEGETVLACGHAIGFEWNGEKDSLPSGWDGVLEKGILDNRATQNINAVSALAIVIDPAHQGKGLSEIMVRNMKELAAKEGYEKMVAPVRPSLKPKYPLIPMEDYAHLERDGKPFDPWLRVHCKLGATILKVAHESMVIKGTVQDWESWTGMSFLISGQYVIPGGLVPISISIEEDAGVYIEPNVWLEHVL